MSGYVYIFDVGDGWIKLGTSINWGCRLAKLRYWHKEGCPEFAAQRLDVAIKKSNEILRRGI